MSTLKIPVASPQAIRILPCQSYVNANQKSLPRKQGRLLQDVDSLN